MYRWAPDGTFEKLRSANQLAGGDTLRYRYRNVRLGRLHAVDLTNPLRPVLFYRDAQTVVWLHRNLTELRQLNLLDVGLAAVDAVAYAPSEGLWVYATDRQQLLQLDRDAAIRYEGPELSQTFGQPIHAAQLVASPQQVALATTDGRLLLFGPFGGYRTQVLRPARNLSADGDRLVFHEAGDWYYYSGRGLPIERLRLDAGEERLLAYRGGRALFTDATGANFQVRDVSVGDEASGD